MSHFWSWKRVKRQCHKAYCKGRVTHYIVQYGRKTAAVCFEHLADYEGKPHTEIIKKQVTPQWSKF